MVVKTAALGDSLTEGWGLLPSQAWPAILEKRLASSGRQVRISNHGVSGDTTLDGLARLGYVLDEKPKAVVVQFGTNDIFQGLSPDIVARNLDTILSRLGERSIRAMLVGARNLPSLSADEIQAMGRVFEEAARAHQALFTPCILKGVTGDPELCLPDGVHPNPAGQERMADTLEPELLRLVEDLALAGPGGSLNVSDDDRGEP